VPSRSTVIDGRGPIDFAATGTTVTGGSPSIVRVAGRGACLTSAFPPADSTIFVQSATSTARAGAGSGCCGAAVSPSPVKTTRIPVRLGSCWVRRRSSTTSSGFALSSAPSESWNRSAPAVCRPLSITTIVLGPTVSVTERAARLIAASRSTSGSSARVWSIRFVSWLI
jgi:hypothetical protein